MKRTAGLVLAAGEGRRFGGPKAPYVLDGERLVDRAVRTLHDAACDPVLVVLGAWVGDVPGAEIILNPDWSSGMGSSLRIGLEALTEHADVGRVVVTLVDLPGLTSAAVRRLVEYGGDLAAATYDDERGHPVLLGHGHWSAVAETALGDRGARDYLTAHPTALVEVGDIASGDDLDIRPT